MKIVFMGTPDFSVKALEALINKKHEIVYVVTMPDKNRGRGQKVTFSPVKTCAINNNIKVLQPEKLNDETFINTLKNANADVFVVVAYGKIISKTILDIPKLGCINIHASLLPDYRGAAPIQWAIIDGLKTTGITTMMMDEGLDTGDILKQYTIKIDEKETSGSLFEKLSLLGASAIVDTLDELSNNLIIPVKQKDSKTKYARMITKQDAKINFDMTATEIERLIRGLYPSPKLAHTIGDKNVKIILASLINKDDIINNNDKNIGEFFEYENDLYLKCKDTALKIDYIQMEGKKQMTGAEFIRGYRRLL